MDYSFLQFLDSYSLADILSGKDMVRLPFNSRQPMQQDWSTMALTQHHACTSWAIDLGHALSLRARPCWCYAWPSVDEMLLSPAAAAAELQFTRAGVGFRDPVCTVEDKD